MRTKKLEAGSSARGGLPDGCVMCTRGSKMVLFVTGICGSGCFYCPVSDERMNKDVMYANETRISSLEEMIEEAERMGAEGTGITGGDPLMDMERTVAAIGMLKERFGKDHHIHLYTSTIDPARSQTLRGAGLDELRLHPPADTWTSLPEDIKKITSIDGLNVGFEVPALPDRALELKALVHGANGLGIKFININELEFSEGNWDMMSRYEIKDETSAAVLGSGDLVRSLMDISEIPIHFCSSAFKDSVQLRRRLIRIAERTVPEYGIVTEDGTVLKGIIRTDDPENTVKELKDEYGVPDGLAKADTERGLVETAPWILEEISGELRHECFIVEEYPTSDRLEVERIPLPPQGGKRK